MSYLERVGTRQTPQSEPILGSDQTKNRAGGFTFEVDDWVRLDRFLILGTQNGYYYAGEAEMTRENAAVVERCIKADGARTVNAIVDVSTNGRSPKNDVAIFALAMAAKLGDEYTRRLALDAVQTVCRIGTHLFTFATFIEQFGGWGRGTQRAVAKWYTRDLSGPALNKVAYQAVKYRSRKVGSYTWTHADMLRLAKPKPPRGEDFDRLFAWIVGKKETDMTFGLPDVVEGFMQAQVAESPRITANLIGQYGLPREAVKTEHLNSAAVWEALAEDMPITALIRNLAKMTSVGLLTPSSKATGHVVQMLADAERLKRGRVHPINVLIALRTYALGRGQRGSMEWAPVPQIIDALDEAFYLAFGSIQPTGKRHLLALDVSGSMMMNSINGLDYMTAREGAAAMMMTVAQTEPMYEGVAFAGPYVEDYDGWGHVNQSLIADGEGIAPFPISKRQRLDDVIKRAKETPFGPTDCALPMLYALDQGREVDVFIVYTDNETWRGDVHPVQALQEYRRQTGIPAKLVVMSFAATASSIADPNDAGSLDVVGLDGGAPAVIADFIRDREPESSEGNGHVA